MLLEQAAHDPHTGETRDLVAEANHRFANSLALISATISHQSRALSDPENLIPASRVRGLLGEVQSRIAAAGRLHRFLSVGNPDEPVDVGIYLRQVVSDAVASLARPDSVTLHFACDIGCRMPTDRAFHIGLMVVELIVNSIKHAHPAEVAGKIEVRCRRDPRCVVVDVSDDGVGLPEGFEVEHHAGEGLRLIKSLADQMGAQVAFENDGLGLHCEITAPIAVAVGSTGGR